MSLRAVPLSRPEANALVASLHRHHRPVHAHKFAIGAELGGRLVGAVIAGNPVSSSTDRKAVCEVLRLVTDGSKNACSFLYARAAAAAEAMGYRLIQTFILDSEPGTSLLAAGWTDAGVTKAGDWDHRPGRSTPGHLRGPKRKFIKRLKRNV